MYMDSFQLSSTTRSSCGSLSHLPTHTHTSFSSTMVAWLCHTLLTSKKDGDDPCNEATITTGNGDDPCNVNKVITCDVAKDTSAVLTEM
jgi:hypothetical protein